LIWAFQEKPVDNKKLSIKNLINEELKLLEIQASQKEIKIHNRIDANLDVVTDKNKVATVLRNLISNAISIRTQGCYYLVRRLLINLLK
jgi:signal transduction histidine kinase